MSEKRKRGKGSENEEKQANENWRIAERANEETLREIRQGKIRTEKPEYRV